MPSHGRGTVSSSRRLDSRAEMMSSTVCLSVHATTSCFRSRLRGYYTYRRRVSTLLRHSSKHSADQLPSNRTSTDISSRVQSGSADVRSPQHIDAVVLPSLNPGSRTWPQPEIDHFDAVSTFHDDSVCKTHFSMLCTGSLELTIENCSQ